MKKKINVSGRWNVREEYHVRDKKRPKYIEYRVSVEQEGLDVEMTMEDVDIPPIRGILDGKILRMAYYTYPEDGGITTVTDFVLTVSDDGKSAISEDSWRWQHRYDRSEYESGIAQGEWSKEGDVSKDKPKVGDNGASNKWRYPKDPLALFDMAWERAKQDPDFIEEYNWLMDVARNTDISTLGKKEFLDRYTWVVYVSGFKVSIIAKIWDLLKKAYYEFSPEKINEDCIQRAMIHFAHKGKAMAVVKTAYILRQMSWGAFVEKYLSGLSRMERLPFIGPATRYHLARNLGMGYAKPDRHLLRIAKHCGFGDDVQALCEYIAEKKNIWVGVVDMVLWFLGAEFGTHELDNSGTAKPKASIKAGKVSSSDLGERFEKASLNVPWTLIPNEAVPANPYKFQPVQNTKDIELCETFSRKLSKVDPDIQETFICLVKILSQAWERKSTQNEYRFQTGGHPFIFIEVKKDYIDISIKVDRIGFSDPDKIFEDWPEGEYHYKYAWTDNKEDAQYKAEYILRNVG